MIEQFLPIEEVSVYAMAIYIASVIAVPARAMHQITYPMTAALLNQKNMPELKKLYQRSSITLFVVGGLVFVLIGCNINELYRLIPPEYHLGLKVYRPIANIVLKSSIIAALYIFVMFRFNVSKDISQLIGKVLERCS